MAARVLTSGHPPETITRVLTYGHSPGPLKQNVTMKRGRERLSKENGEREEDVASHTLLSFSTTTFPYAEHVSWVAQVAKMT